MNSDVSSPIKYTGTVVEYLDQGRLKAALVTREQERHLAVIDSAGHERLVPRDLVLMRHPDRRADREDVAEVLAELERERAELTAELDLQLLWEVAQEQGRSFSAAELAELFFGRRSNAAASVMLEALLNDRTYFTRRHMDFVPRTPDQVERLRIQNDRIRARSDDYRKIQKHLRDVLNGAEKPPDDEAAALVEELSRYLKNPFTRSRDMTAMLAHAAPEVDPAEAAFEILERLGARPRVPRFAFIAGLKDEFSDAVMKEAAEVVPGPRAISDGGYAVTVDDEDTVEVDDALSCEALADGGIRVRVHIALVADFVAKGSAMDQEAASRATTVYLPETTIRMLPDPISCRAASLIAGEDRPVLTTDVRLSADGELLDASIYPARIPIMRRLDYDQVDRILESGASADDTAATVARLNAAAGQLRQRRRTAGAVLVQRREAKVRVRGDEVEITIIDNGSPGRALVAEFMVLSNFVAARYAAANRIPIIYRVQPQLGGGDMAAMRPRLSLHPEYHAGIGLDFYAQLSSPIRRYADLVLQRQLLGALANRDHEAPIYNVDELLAVLAGAENAEASGRELERRAKRYWTLRYLERHAHDGPILAYVAREGQSAELADFAVRGTLHGAPTLPNQMPVMVQVSRVDPLRGWLAFDFVGPADEASTGAIRTI
ncbi:MAG TPA: ribonuclease catalytic domain-containing protein [Candidatus Binatus sp.]|uniref:ribonuclease catalytic domain-containing protein n=1 Tax=Candidatus Binatus sp. TaxID=2811406 RepID=UPI002B465400|nr:ribonuclease catalytic domain-containing protein [Candidatus Binatus sp.]HKN13996.1 ribonuclease catalytic domain-containing protein [Candidatus Binatus sp.]